ncbi:MAG: sugar phosphate isomerase/epimerase [Lachnospiraceae bacterium]|nr:sugar phosphate isomerase/epimerase [Lachnospiraceae bacterium]
MKEKLLVGIGSKELLPESNLEDNLRMLKECGFESVIYSIKENDLKMQANRHVYFGAFFKAAKNAGIAISQIHFKYDEEIKECNDYIESLHNALHICNTLKCPFLVIDPIQLKDSVQEKEINLKIYRSLTPVAKKYDIKICLINTIKCAGGYHQHAIQGACADAAEAVWYIDTLNVEAGEEIFGFCLDTGCANVTARDMERFIITLGSRLKCVHISDNNGISDDHLMPYTQTLGQVDWQGFIAGLNRIGYEGALTFDVSRSIHTFPEEVRPHAMKVIAAVGKCMRKSIEAES